jgi:hypothetical protein
MSYKDSGVMWRNIWLLLVDSVKLFYTVSAYKLNPYLIENKIKTMYKIIQHKITNKYHVQEISKCIK